MQQPICVFALLLAVSPLNYAICAAQTKPAKTPTTLKPVSGGPTTIDAKLDVAQHYTKQMASQANLDVKKPQLSTDGFLSQAAPALLASSECMLAQTLLAAPGGMTSDQINTLCTSLSTTSDAAPMTYEKATGASQKGPTIDYALIHIVRWDVSTTGTGAPTPTGAWYLFDRGHYQESGSIIPWKNVSGVSPITATTHLLGSKNVAFLAIQLGIDDSCGIKYDLSSTHTKPLNQQDVTNLIQTAISIFGTSSKTTTPTKSTTTGTKAPPPPPPPAGSVPPWVGVWGGEVMVKQDRLPASLAMTPSMGGTVRALGEGETKLDGEDDSIVATCAAAPKPVTGLGTTPPINGESLQQSYAGTRDRTAHFQLALYTPSSSVAGDATRHTLFLMQAPASPASGSTNSGNSQAGNPTPKDPLAGFAQTITNEPTHHWDVSIAMPVMSYNSLKYDSTNNLLVPKTTTSVIPYALFDVYPVAVDLAGYSGTGVAISFPKFTAGIPIGNQPLQKPFVGVGFVGTVKSFHFQPIVGLHIQKEVRADSATSTLTHTEWHAKLQVMIGFSITDAKKVLGIK